MSEETPRPTLRMPLKNFKYVGELTKADVEWWQSYGRHPEQARKHFSPVPTWVWRNRP